MDKVKSNFFSLVKLFFLLKIARKIGRWIILQNLEDQKQFFFTTDEKCKTFDWYANIFSLTFTITTKKREGGPEKIKFLVDFFSPQNTLKICWKTNQHKKQLFFHAFWRSYYTWHETINHIFKNFRNSTLRKQSQLVGKCGTDLHSIYIVDQ